jgi:hypothetical protein
MDNPWLSNKLAPPSPNIQVVNLKSKSDPFIIFEPSCRMRVYVGRVRKGVSNFSAYNHFPVSLMPSDGRYAVAPDRVMSFSISYTDPPRHAGSESTTWASWLYGTTGGQIKDLAGLARSWAKVPEMKIQGSDYMNEGYDLSQRAYVLDSREPGKGRTIEAEMSASAESPLANACFVVKVWGDKPAQVAINGQALKDGIRCPTALIPTLETTDLIVWLPKESVFPIKIDIRPKGH